MHHWLVLTGFTSKVQSATVVRFSGGRNGMLWMVGTGHTGSEVVDKKTSQCPLEFVKETVAVCYGVCRMSWLVFIKKCNKIYRNLVGKTCQGKTLLVISEPFEMLNVMFLLWYKILSEAEKCDRFLAQLWRCLSEVTLGWEWPPNREWPLSLSPQPDLAVVTGGELWTTQWFWETRSW